MLLCIMGHRALRRQASWVPRLCTCKPKIRLVTVGIRAINGCCEDDHQCTTRTSGKDRIRTRHVSI